MDLNFAFLFRSCLRGEDAGEPELYERLGITIGSTSEEIRSAYKKATLKLHPDKLAQRGLKATPEDSMKFQKAKEAFDILSDRKRKHIYDQYGLKALKAMENPR
jgi:DnaJ-class molecular chaperone